MTNLTTFTALGGEINFKITRTNKVSWNIHQQHSPIPAKIRFFILSLEEGYVKLQLEIIEENGVTRIKMNESQFQVCCF